MSVSGCRLPITFPQASSSSESVEVVEMARITKSGAYTDGIWAALLDVSTGACHLPHWAARLPNAAAHESEAGSSMQQCQLC